MKNILLATLLLSGGFSSAHEIEISLRVSSTPLTKAIIQQDVQEIENLINANTNEDIFLDGDKITPLIFAAASCSPLSTKTLLNLGADLEEKQENVRYTALHLAALWGCPETINVLVKHGANLKAEDIDGATPLLWASKHFQNADALLALGAGPNHINSKGITPLMYAAKVKRHDLMEYLIRKGANVNLHNKTKDGVTPLIESVIKDDAEGIELLCSLGADPNLPSKGGTPLMFAIAQGAGKAAKALLSCGADVNYVWKSENSNITLLEYAIYKRNVVMQSILLSIGADTYAVNEAGLDALGYAYRFGNWGSVLLILVHRYNSPVFYGSTIAITLRFLQEANIYKALAKKLGFQDKKIPPQQPSHKITKPKRPSYRPVFGGPGSGLVTMGFTMDLTEDLSDASDESIDEYIYQALKKQKLALEKCAEKMKTKEKAKVKSPKVKIKLKDKTNTNEKATKEKTLPQAPTRLLQTNVYLREFLKLTTQQSEQLTQRIEQITAEHDYGDLKRLSDLAVITQEDGTQIQIPLYELRFMSGGMRGKRVYIVSVDGKTLTFLLIGNKQTQDRDIQFLSGKSQGSF